jgi:hypothetical protein
MITVENYDIKKINNEFEQTLIDNGYKFFKDNWHNALRGIQKRFEDEKGIKYYITGYHHNYSIQYSDHQTLSSDNLDRYNFKVQFRYDKREVDDKSGKDQTIDVSFSADFVPNPYRPLTSLKEVEDFFEKMFVDFKFDYYELKES